VADEENGSGLGVQWLTEHRLDLIDADYVLTESGGAPAGSKPSMLSQLEQWVFSKNTCWEHLSQ